MRVLHVACVAPPDVGGIGAAAAREVRGLRARGIDARLVAPTPVIPGQMERSYIEYLPPRLRFGNGAVLPGLIELAQGYDVIHLHYPFFGAAEPLLLRARQLPPIVMTFHMDAKTQGWKRLVVALHRWMLQPFLLPRAKRLLVSSFDYARHSSLARWFARAPERVLEVPFGVDTDVFSPGPDERVRLGIPPTAKTVLSVGGMDAAHAFKGVPELLQVIAKLPEQVHVLLVGDGELRAGFEELATSLGIRGRTHFLGRVDTPTLVRAYRSADVFAFPSTSAAEAFGLVVLEAAAVGVPAVASSWPGVRTVIEHGITGMLVPPGDAHALLGALQTLLFQDVERRAMGEAARVRVGARFSWERHVDALVQVYEQVVKRV